MSFVTNILTPIISGVFIGGFIIWILFMIYAGIKKSCPHFNFWLKYTVFRKKFDEKVVEWCMEAISKEMNPVVTEKFLLNKGVKIKKTKEMMYIYDQVLKNTEGGVKNEQLRQGNEQTEIPEL